MTDHGHHQAVLDDLGPQHRELRRAIPDVYAGFGELSKAALASGAVDASIKELVAVAIGVVNGCDGCIVLHHGAPCVPEPPRSRRRRSSVSRS